MTSKQSIVKAITEMNSGLLEVILDNDKAYMEVSKNLFINTLSKKFKELQKQGITKFEKVYKGTCQKCYLGCSGFTFLTKNNDYLDLLIEEKDNKITDITQCMGFKNEEELTKEKNIFIYFKKDSRITYKPTSTLSFLQREIEKAELEFKSFENQIIDLEVLEIWFDKWTELFNSVRYKILDYSFVPSFISTYYSTQDILSLKKENLLAKKALTELNKFEISEQKKLINWLLKYKDNQVYSASSSFSKTDNWNKTNFIIFKNVEDFFNDGFKYYDNIIIDIKGYLDSIRFGEFYSKYYYEFYNIIEQKQDGINCSDQTDKLNIMNTQDDLQNAWLKFIEKFTGEKFDEEKKIKPSDFRFEVQNFLQTGIKLNDSYGFLTVDFKDKSCNWSVQDFIAATKITFNSQRLNQTTLQSTKWSINDYPCRIFGADNKGKIRFYPSDKIEDFDKLLDSYITVFQSVVFAIINLKIESASE